MKVGIGIAAIMALSLSFPIVGHAEEQNLPKAEGTRVTGQLTHIEGWHYTIKDARGEELSFGVTSATKDPDRVKEGDYIVVMIGDDRIAVSH